MNTRDYEAATQELRETRMAMALVRHEAAYLHDFHYNGWASVRLGNPFNHLDIAMAGERAKHYAVAQLAANLILNGTI